MNSLISTTNTIVPMKLLTHLEPSQKGVLGIYQGMIEPTYKILDLGCGHKIVSRYLLCEKLVGMDIHPEYLTKRDILGDVRQLAKLVKPNSYDCILCCDLIEHLTITEGIQLIKDMERVAKKKIIVFTPTKWNDNKEAVQNPDLWSYGNVYNLHKSLWSAEDFKTLGFTRMETVYDEHYIIAVKEVNNEVQK